MIRRKQHLQLALTCCLFAGCLDILGLTWLLSAYFAPPSAHSTPHTKSHPSDTSTKSHPSDTSTKSHPSDTSTRSANVHPHRLSSLTQTPSTPRPPTPPSTDPPTPSEPIALRNTSNPRSLNPSTHTRNPPPSAHNASPPSTLTQNSSPPSTANPSTTTHPPQTIDPSTTTHPPQTSPTASRSKTRTPSHHPNSSRIKIQKRPFLRLFFPLGKATLSAKDQRRLKTWAKRIQKQQRSVFLLGYTDPSGDLTFNLWLRKERVRVVRQQLLQHGLSPQRIGIHPAPPPLRRATRTRSRSKQRRVELYWASHRRSP